MRFSFIVLPFSLISHCQHVAGELAKDPFGSSDALAGLKDFVSIAEKLSSLVNTAEIDREASKQNQNERNSEPQDPNNLLQGLEALTQIKNVANIASTLFSVLEDNDKGSFAKGKRGSQKRDLNSGLDQGGEGIDLVKGLGALQQLASLAGGLGSLADGVDPGVSKTKPVRKAGNGDGVGAEASGDQPFDILKGLDALQKEDGNKPSHDAEIGNPAGRKVLPEKVKASKRPAKPQPQPNEPADFISRLEAIKTFTTVASRFSSLTDTTDSTPLHTRLESLLSDAELLTPEVLAGIKNFVRTSPLVPPEYLPTALTVVDSLSAVFSPEFAAHYHSVKQTLDDVGIDPLPYLGYIWRTAQWAIEVSLWRKALASEEMAEFLSWISDPETISSVTSSIEGIKDKLTAKRIHRLNLLFKTEGLFTLSDAQYQSFGAELGAKFRAQFATRLGLGQIRVVLHVLESLLRDGSYAGNVVGHIRLRARVLTPDLADDIALLLDKTLVGRAFIPAFVDALGDAVTIIHPLLEFEGRADRVLSWAFWTDLDRSFQELQSALAVLERLLESQRAHQLRLLLDDVTGSVSAPPVLGFNSGTGSGNASMLFGSEDGLLRTGMMPVLAPDEMDEIVALLKRIDAFLAEGNIEGTREAVCVLNQGLRFVYRLVEVFEEDGDGDGEAEGSTAEGSHDEL
ncbi:hypothetical protein BJY04DRAFT_230888 [Aspergillus karnatakaensis]|uniref:uncharacterized protein n=1 Tax=Aspergillus karnatakaensis TaxID=1810916 RepID=UPI003CCE3848